jgi:DNA-binding PadR family transcriptional regulator
MTIRSSRTLEFTVKTTDWLVLSKLALCPSSGYDLYTYFDQHGPYLGFRPTLSPIYRTLARLVERGYAEFDVEARTNAPDAKVYRVTSAGREALLAWAREPHTPSPRPQDPDFMVKFSYAGQFGREIAIDVLRRELAYRRAQKTAESDIGLRTGPLDPVPEIDVRWLGRLRRIGHARGYAATAAYIAWLELTLAELEAEETDETLTARELDSAP